MGRMAFARRIPSSSLTNARIRSLMLPKPSAFTRCSREVCAMRTRYHKGRRRDDRYGKSPASIRSRRTSTRSGWFIASTESVVRPIAVLPRSTGPSPLKVGVPSIPTRVEEPGELLRHRVDTREVRSLVVVVVGAGKGEVFQGRLAAVLLGDDMVDGEGEFGDGGRNPAILAPVLGSFPDLPLERFVHGGF